MTFNSPPSIIERAEYLSPDIIPEKITGRIEQIEKLRQCLRPMEKSCRPTSAWLYGPPGAGKTTAARKTAEQFSGTSNRVCLYVNCWERPTLYSTVQALCEELNIFGADAKDANIKLARLKQVLKDRPMLIILDNIDRCVPKERDLIIYQLLGLPKTGLFCISRGCGSFLELEDRVRSKLTPAHVHFPKYSASEIKTILVERARDGLMPEACSENILRKIALRADGDARAALYILIKAAVAAEQNYAPKIAERHIPSDVSAWQKAEQVSKIELLTKHQQIIYKLVNKYSPVYSADLRQLYLSQCCKTSIKPKSGRTFSRYIETLAEKNLIAIKPPTAGGLGKLIKTVV